MLSYKLHLFSIVVVVILLNTLTDAHRNITIEHNPGCNLTVCHDTNSSVNLMYIRSEGHESCVHYILSTIHSPLPILLLLKTNVISSKVSINWNRLLSTSLNSSDIYGSVAVVDENGSILNEPPISALYVFNQIIEYRDVSDTANIFDPKVENITTIPLTALSWNVSLHGDYVNMKGSSNINTPWFTKYTSLQIQLAPFNTNGYDKSPPRLVHNDLSLKVEFIMDNLTTRFTNSRFSVSIIVANPGNASYASSTSIDAGVIYKHSIKSIDDEYAPSVFTTTQLLWKSFSTAFDYTNFWQWRTVCYTQSNPTIKYSTDIKSSSLVFNNQTYLNPIINRNRFLISYFGPNLKKIKFKSSVISFGKSEDKYYAATKYLSWSSLVGFGSAPEDSFSVLAICIIFAGIGCPAVVLILGALFMAFRKCRNGSQSSFSYKSEYQPIG